MSDSTDPNHLDREAQDAGPRSPADPDPEGLSAEAAGDLLTRYTRLAADFDNFRKRTAREQGERLRYAAEPAARALLPVLDNLRRAVDAAPEDADGSLLEGIRFTVRQFEDALESVGVQHIDALGKPFDPAWHEAVAGEESDAVTVDTVVDELQRGYRIGDRVVRPSVVRVAHPRHVAVPGGGAPSSLPRRPQGNGGVHHDLPAEPGDEAPGGGRWMEA
ncbi:MAG TPA: nucleotide exchange factor GrpE [Candidatus Dormibacteraeota bacterium]|nr:nucleotide exchange factor GrpE [Candidatus Dormibacteraeota bacterium]